MKYWRVGLREENAEWFASNLDGNGNAVAETKQGRTTAGDAFNLLLRELEDWDAYRRVRFLD